MISQKIFIMSMAMRLTSLFFLLFGFLLFSCNSDSDSEPEDFTEVSFSPGTTFVYQYTAVETDSTYSEVLGIIEEFDLEVRVVSSNRNFEGVISSFKTETSSPDFEDAISRTWYVEQEERLIEIAYQNPGFYPSIQPRPTDDSQSESHIYLPAYSPYMMEVLAGRSGIYPDDDSIIPFADEDGDILMRDDPRIVFEYPLEEGKEWVSFSQPFEQIRKVEAVTTVDESPIGKPLIEIQTQISSDPDFLWIDLIQNDGIFYREFRLLSTADPSGQGDLYVRFTKELVDVR